MPNTGHTGPDPGDSNSTAVTQTGVVEVFGNPSDGGVPTWNATTGRFEWGTGGSGTSSAPSATGIGSLDSDNTPPVVVTAGTAPHIDFTGATITSGEDYWGVPGSALPLALGVNGSGWAVLPEGEATYTTQTFLRLTCDPADAGRMVGLSYQGNDNDNHTWAPVRADGLWEAYVQCPDRVFLGDTSPLVVITLHGEHLTVDATYTQGCSLVVYKVP